MKHMILAAGAALAVGVLTGCANTAEGVKKDAQENIPKAAEATKEAMKKAGEAGKDIGAATLLTPAVKSAITEDKSLNDPGNAIDVDSTNEEVVLTGHVKTESMKTLASAIAERVVKEKGSGQKVVNRLEVKP